MRQQGSQGRRNRRRLSSEGRGVEPHFETLGHQRFWPASGPHLIFRLSRTGPPHLAANLAVPPASHMDDLVVSTLDLDHSREVVVEAYVEGVSSAFEPDPPCRPLAPPQGA